MPSAVDIKDVVDRVSQQIGRTPNQSEFDTAKTVLGRPKRIHSSLQPLFEATPENEEELDKIIVVCVLVAVCKGLDVCIVPIYGTMPDGQNFAIDVCVNISKPLVQVDPHTSKGDA